MKRAAAAEGYVRVRWHLEIDAEGWPPVGSEGLWAEPLGDETYRIDNIPWFARGVASGDTVCARVSSDGVLWVTEHVRWSGNLTIRVIPLGHGPLAGDLERTRKELSGLGIESEANQQHGIMSVNVEQAADLAALKATLRRGEADGWWAYEEGCISDAWRAIA